MGKILTAGKYSRVGALPAGREARPGVMTPARGGYAGPALGKLGRALFAGSGGRNGQSAGILVPNRKKLLNWGEFMWREMREGGFLKRYLERERATSVDRQRRTARQFHGVRPNPRSDVRLEAAIPLREYIRWKAEDPHFFEDRKNLKSLKRDNPDLPIFV